MLEERKIPIEELFLDPNNPRFVSDLRSHKHIEDRDIIAVQDKTLSMFSSVSSSEESATDTTDLYNSMMTIGYVPIDRVVVRKLSGAEGYLVIEGNRRISTVKKICSDYKNKTGKLEKDKARKPVKPLLESFKSIDCMFLETLSLTEVEVAHKVAVILGLRHHGSLLAWEALPRAYSMYTEYMTLCPEVVEFKFDNKRVKSVATQLSIKVSEVKDALKTYVVYLQLSQVFDVKENAYSLVRAGVTNSALNQSYFRIDSSTFSMDEASLEKMNRLCQFEKRDILNTQVEKKVLKDPKSFLVLGKLVAKIKKSESMTNKAHGLDLLTRVEDETDVDMTLEEALDDFTNLEESTKWAETIGKLLEKQKELPISEYTGKGNDRANKDALKNRLEPLKRILGL